MTALACRRRLAGGGTASRTAPARRGCRFSTQNNWLSCAEGNDSADRVIWGNADGDAVAGDDLDAEAAHPTAQLRQYLVARIALHAVQPAGMHGHDRSLHIYEIVLTQSALPFARLRRGSFKGMSRGVSSHHAAARVSNECAIAGEYVQCPRRHEFGGIQALNDETRGPAIKDCGLLPRLARPARRNRHLAGAAESRTRRGSGPAVRMTSPPA